MKGEKDKYLLAISAACLAVGFAKVDSFAAILDFVFRLRLCASFLAIGYWSFARSALFAQRGDWVNSGGSQGWQQAS